MSFKKRAPKAIKEIKAFAHKEMGTVDVRLDPQLNKEVWKSGIKGVPYRLRIRVSRKRNDEEGAKTKLFSFVQAVNVKNPKGLHTTLVRISYPVINSDCGLANTIHFFDRSRSHKLLKSMSRVDPFLFGYS